jgi:hypothetical protein
MKKLLLSSLIMFGVCGIASAQTDAKVKQNAAPTTSFSTASGATAPQKSTVASSDAAAVPATVNDVDAAQTNSSAKPARISKTAPTTVNAAGEVVPATDANAKQAREAKAAAAKAAPAPKKVIQN